MQCQGKYVTVKVKHTCYFLLPSMQGAAKARFRKKVFNAVRFSSLPAKQNKQTEKKIGDKREEKT